MSTTTKQWHYSDGVKSFGPLDSSLIKQLVATGVVGPGHTLRREGEDAWLPLAEVDFDAPSSAVGAPPAAPHPDLAANEYLMIRNGETTGPYRVDLLRAMILRQEVNASDFVWRAGMDTWSRVRDLPELRLAGNLLPPPPPESALVPPPEAMNPAIVLGADYPVKSSQAHPDKQVREYGSLPWQQKTAINWRRINSQ